jgi:hypothetical protein
MLSLGMVLNLEPGPSLTFCLFAPFEIFSMWRKTWMEQKKSRTLFFALVELFSVVREV